MNCVLFLYVSSKAVEDCPIMSKYSVGAHLKIQYFCCDFSDIFRPSVGADNLADVLHTSFCFSAYLLDFSSEILSDCSMLVLLKDNKQNKIL